MAECAPKNNTAVVLLFLLTVKRLSLPCGVSLPGIKKQFNGTGASGCADLINMPSAPKKFKLGLRFCPCRLVRAKGCPFLKTDTANGMGSQSAFFN